MTKQFGNGGDPWTDGELLFNAIIWATSTRMWGASKELTTVMRRPVKKSDVSWGTVDLLMPDAEINVGSRNDGTPFQNLNNEPDTDDLAPKGCVTKQFWKNFYLGIFQRDG